MENNKKILVPTIVAVATLVLLVFGATYAYFTIGSTNNFGTKELNATVEDVADAVVLEQVENELSLSITRTMMDGFNVGTYYYASGSDTPANIAKMSVAGDGIYKCNYKLTITKSASSTANDLYKAIVENGVEFNDPELDETIMPDEALFYINNSRYFLTESNLFPMVIEDTIYNISKDTPKYLVSNLMIANAEHPQNSIKGKDMKLTYTITNFDCELSEPTDEISNVSLNSEHLEALGYYTSEEQDFLSQKNLVIPEIFQGKDGNWYRVTSIGGFGQTGYYIESIELPDSVVTIEDTGLFAIEAETIKLPKQLTTVGEAVFADGSVSNLYLPKSLVNISPGFLVGTYGNLENIYYEGSESEWNAIFAESVGNGKDYESITGYLYGISTDEELAEYEMTLPPINYNVNY